MSSFNPGRPPSVNDLLLNINGDFVFLGVLVSTGAAVNNRTTATPFNDIPLGAAVDPVRGTFANMTNTLAGRTLVLQASVAGVFLTSPSPSISIPTVTTVALQSVIPVAAGTAPGFHIGASPDARVITMKATSGWLQWLPLTGSANLFVWEQV